MKMIAVSVAVLLLLVVFGCTQQNTPTVYVCSDGRQVANASSCIPQNQPQGNQNQPSARNNTNMPPSEAIAACSGKAIGDACEFTSKEGSISGVCNDKPGVLACAPDRSNGSQQPGQGNQNQPSQQGSQNQKQQANQTSQNLTLSASALSCISNTKDNPACKDCCDCMNMSGSDTKNCRDTCATHDFSTNSNFITVSVASTLGPNGDYSKALAFGNAQDCKIYCDTPSNLLCGDKRFCRTACDVTYENATAPGQGGNQSQPPPQGNGTAQGQGSQYTITQAISDNAQLNTLAFSGLGFLTGDLCSDSFLPPGKVADFFGFQHLRDITANGKGHDTDFVTNSANNVLYILNADQKAKMLALAKTQGAQVNQFAYGRYPLMLAFRRQLTGDIPSGTAGLSKGAVENYSASLYVQDAQISIQRAKLYSSILNSLNATQKAYLDSMVKGGFASWPVLPDQVDKVTWTHDEDVLVMTYASEMFGWYAGDIEADTYFCPERQADYFGGFYIKDAPAIGNAGYTIDESITGDQGAAFIALLDSKQQPLVTGLVDTNKDTLNSIVDTRREMSIEFRKYLTTGSADESKLLSLGAAYGKLDGDISYNAATAFAQVGKTLTSAQKTQLMALRNLGNYTCENGKIYLYSEKINQPTIPNTDFLFK